MIGFISGIIVEVETEKSQKKFIEINFLCIDKKLRTKKLAPLLIEEVARRANTKGYFQAIYTSGQVLPTPYAQARYYHRAINPEKLIDCGFSSLPRKQSLKQHLKIHEISDDPPVEHVRPMIEKDINQVVKLLNNYLSKFAVRQMWNKTEVRHS